MEKILRVGTREPVRDDVECKGKAEVFDTVLSRDPLSLAVVR